MKRMVFFTLSLFLAVAALSFATGSKEASSTASTANSSTAVPSIGTAPIVLNAYFETGFDIPFKLADEFTKQFPNVTWNIKQDQFSNLINETPRLLAGDNPPDLIRLPTMVSFAKQGLLMNLDGYAKAFGWDKWPVPQLNQNRVAADGTRGSGALYAMGLNYSLTGVFYNKTAGGPDRHERTAQDGRRVRGSAREGQGRGTPPDHGVGEREKRHGARVSSCSS